MDGSAESNDAAAGHLSMTKEKSRAPECIRKRLLAALDKIAKGPSCDPFFGTDGFHGGDHTVVATSLGIQHTFTVDLVTGRVRE